MTRPPAGEGDSRAGGGDSRKRRAGLQVERTDLAWNRTAVVAAGCALLLLDVAVREGLRVVALVPAVLTGLLAVGLALLGRRLGTPGWVLAVLGVLLTAACLSSLPIAI